jgi:alpha-tubulin suppressor-like RCC1 family protein
VLVSGPLNKDIVKVSAGWLYSVMINKNGSIISFGRGSEGRLGTGSTSNELIPVKLSIEDIIDIDAGGDHVICLNKYGYVFGMGLNNVRKLNQIYKYRKVNLVMQPPLTDWFQPLLTLQMR